MKVKAGLLLFGVLVFWSSQPWAHGENKLGPHNGFIRMPGAFHTELVPVGEFRFEIYLLDIAWKNPSVLNSEVVLIHKADKESQATCRIEKDHFICDFETTLDLKNHELIVKSRRENQQGQDVTYPLPLSLVNEMDMPAAHH